MRGKEADLCWIGGGWRPRKLYLRCFSYSVERTRRTFDCKDRTESNELDRSELAMSGSCYQFQFLYQPHISYRSHLLGPEEALTEVLW